MSFDAAVVGSGPNGLCAAIRLARAGRSVVVYEARAWPGGAVHSEEATLPGFVHDSCSSIHPMAVGAPFLRSLNLERHGLRWVQPELPLAHPLPDGTAALLARDLDATAAELGGDARALRWLFGPFVGRWQALFDDALGPPGFPASPLLLARFGLRAFVPALHLGRLLFRGERARALLAGLAGHSVLPLERAPSAAIGLMLGIAGLTVGWPFPRGGAGALTAALVAELQALGGELRTGQPIERLDELPTRGPVLFDTGPGAMARIAGEALPEGYRRRLNRYRYGPGIFKLDWALDGPIPWRDPRVARAATVHIGASDAEIAASERAVWRGELVERPYLIVGQHAAFDETRAPPGKTAAWGYCHVPAGCTADATERIEAQVERYAPGFRERILARRALSPAALQARNANLVGGDVNGGAAILSQLFTRPVARWSPYSTPNPRLWIGSASTPPGGGVHGMCGFNAAEALLRRWHGG